MVSARVNFWYDIFLFYFSFEYFGAFVGYDMAIARCCCSILKWTAWSSKKIRVRIMNKPLMLCFSVVIHATQDLKKTASNKATCRDKNIEKNVLKTAICQGWSKSCSRWTFHVKFHVHVFRLLWATVASFLNSSNWVRR